MLTLTLMSCYRAVLFLKCRSLFFVAQVFACNKKQSSVMFPSLMDSTAVSSFACSIAIVCFQCDALRGLVELPLPFELRNSELPVQAIAEAVRGRVSHTQMEHASCVRKEVGRGKQRRSFLLVWRLS